MKKSGAVLPYVLLLAGLWLLQLLLLLGTVLIPRQAVAPAMEQAAAYYETTDDFQILWDRDLPSMVHNYADALLLNILWQQDPARPLESALDGAYYEEPGLSQGENLAAAVDGAEANTPYARYWHGMLVVLKPLLCVLTLGQIKILGALVLALLAAFCLALLWRQRQRTAAISLALGLVLCRIWLVPLCIEYYACFALMLAGTLVVLLKKGQLRRPCLLFLALGTLVCFFDFLTCEILTLGLPLAVLLLLQQKNRRESLKTLVSCSFSWLLAYALTWLVKWGLSAAVLEQSLREIALGQGLYRAAGSLSADVSYGFQPFAAMAVNLSMVQPFQALALAPRIWTCFLVLALVLFSLWYLFRRPENGPALALFLLSLLPFVRYFFISNHAALHPFMTYRDLLLTVLCLSCAMALSMGRRKKGRNGWS